MFVLASNGRDGTLCFFKIDNFRPVDRRLKIRIQNGLTGVADRNAFLGQVTAKMIILGHSKLSLHLWNVGETNHIFLGIADSSSIKLHLTWCLNNSILSLRSDLCILLISQILASDHLVWQWEDSLGQECLLECICLLILINELLVFKVEIEHFGQIWVFS